MKTGALIEPVNLTPNAATVARSAMLARAAQSNESALLAVLANQGTLLAEGTSYIAVLMLRPEVAVASFPLTGLLDA
ncbi:MAG: hypothetical protein ACR2GG_01890 [Gemmatimonadaceae bacterium]